MTYRKPKESSKDDRTPEQKKTHRSIIVGTDSFMSGWGGAQGGLSYAGWACEPDVKDRVFNWVARRSEMKRVREVYGDYRPRGCKHLHIYVVGPDHPALR